MEPAKKKHHKMKKNKHNASDDCELEESSKAEINELAQPEMMSAKDFLNSVVTTASGLPKESLKSFLDQVAEYNTGSSKYDIVADYLKLSGTCSELVELLTRSQSRARDNIPLFAVLEKILLWVAGELHAYENVGQTIVKAILQSGMKSIDSLLSMRQKSGNIKVVFKLLTAMVAQGGSSAKDVMASFDFQKEGLLKLINLRNPQDSQDVRVCFLRFIISFLIAGDNIVIQKLLEEKGFLNAAFPGLPCDNVSIINLFLTTVKEKVLENPGISKTLKIRVLNDSTLKYVFQLLSWTGPKYKIGTKKRKFDKSAENAFVEQEAAEEDVALVREISSGFLRVACCSFKFGIIFHDWSLGTSGKNMNHVITNLLAAAPQPYSNKHLSELILDILKSCPDQVHLFLRSIQSALEPRLSPVWFQAMDFVNKITKSQDPVDVILMSGEKKTQKRFVELFLRLCSPVFPREKLESGLQGNVLEIQHGLMSHISAVLEKVNTTAGALEKRPEVNYSAVELAGFIMALQESVFKFVPDSKVILECLRNVSSPSTELETLVPGLPTVSVADHLAIGFHLLAMCRRVFPLNFGDFSVSNDILLGIVKSRAPSLSSEETEKLHLKILHFLALSEFEIGSLVKSETLEEMPLYMLLEMFVNTTDDQIQLEVRKLLKSLLLSTKLFDDPDLELSLWLRSLQVLNDDLKRDALWTFCTATRNLVSAPHHYADLLGKYYSDAIHESMAREKLGMNLDDMLIGKETAKTSQSFPSTLLLAALSGLRKAKKRRKLGATRYLSIVAREILHHQYQPEVICCILYQYSDILPSSLMKYVTIWLPSELVATELDCSDSAHDEQDLPSSSTALQNVFLSMHTMGTHDPASVLNCSSSFSQMRPSELSSILHQTLLYTHTELQRARAGFSVDAAIMVFISIIDTLLKVVGSSFLKSIGITEEMQEETLFENFLKVVLSHPTFVNWYLIYNEQVTNSRPRDGVEMCLNLMTAFSTKCLETAMEKVGNSENIERIVSPYKQKVLSVLKTSLADQEIEDYWIEMKTYFDLFSRFFTKEDLIEVIENLLGHQQIEADNFDAPGKLTFLNSLFQSFCSQLDASQSTGGLTGDVIQNLLDAIAEHEKSDAETNLATHFLLLLDNYPLYCFALNPECVSLLLEIATIARVKLVIRLSQYSPSHLYMVRHWLEENCSDLVKWHSALAVELINVCLLAQREKVSKTDPLLPISSQAFWNSISTYVIDGSEADDELWKGLDISEVLRALLKGNHIDMQSLEDVVKGILTEAQTQERFPSILRLSTIIQVFDCVKEWEDLCIDGVGSQCVLLQIIVLSISSLLKLEKKLDDTYFQEFLFKSLTLFKSMDDDSIKNAFSKKSPTNWANFIKLSLKHALQCSTTGTHLTSLVNELCSRMYKVKNVNVGLSVSEVHQMLLGHSNFMPIMLGELGSVDMKESVVDLLLSLSILDKSLCQTKYFPILLSSYQPTFKSVDQKLLYLMKCYEVQEASMYEFRPFLWGSAAVSHYAVKKSGGLALLKHPKMEDVLGYLDQEKLQKTALLFPLDLEMEPKSSVENVDSSEIYDPRFLLPLFTHLLSPGSLVNCKKFLESKCMGVAFASLASSDPNMRALGYYVLCQFYQHLEGSFYRERFIWLGLLDSIKNSIEVENQHLSCLITLFLTRVTDLLFTPDDPLYGPIYHFLTLKPFLDLQNVPEFYMLFYSSDLKHRNHREWILTLICNGLRKSLDFHLCQKRFIFNILLTFYSSSVCTHKNKLVILQALNAVSKISGPAFVMCKQHGLMAWMRAVIVEENNEEVLDLLITIMHTLWETGCSANTSRENMDKTINSESIVLNGHVDKTRIESAEVSREKYHFYWSFPMEFLLNCLAMLEKISNHDSTKCLSQYLLTLCNCLSYVQSANRTHSFLTNSHVSQLMKIAQRINLCDGIIPSSLRTTATKENVECAQNRDSITKILLLWRPRQQTEMSEDEGNVTGKLLLQAVQFVLACQHSVRNLPITVASWLSDCLREGRSFIWTKMLLADEASSNKCWDLILNALMLLMVSNSHDGQVKPSLMEVSAISDFISALLSITTLVQERKIHKKEVRKLLRSGGYKKLMGSERVSAVFRSLEEQQTVSKRDIQLAATFLLELWMKKSVPNLSQFLAELQQE